MRACSTCGGTGRVYTRGRPRTCPRCGGNTRRQHASNARFMLTECALNYRMGATSIENLSIAVRRASHDMSLQEMADLCKIPVDTIRSAYER